MPLPTRCTPFLIHACLSLLQYQPAHATKTPQPTTESAGQPESDPAPFL